DNQHQTHYWYPQEIADKIPHIPYPQDNQPIESDFGDLKEEVKSVINSLDTEDWENLSLLTLILEKYGSFISFGDEDVALIDIAKSTAAVAAALTNNPDISKLTLIAGGLSGIQNFIYTISSDGALKSLRARSFYLELVTEEVVQQVLGDLKLPRNNVIYAGGSNLYILASGDVEGIEKSLNIIRQRFNKWLLKEFDGKISLNLDYLDFPTEDIITKKFAEHWSDISQKLNEQKSRKFSEQIAQFIQPKTSYEPCKVCHRDDDDNLEILNPNEPDSPLACKNCREMFNLGGELFKLGSIVRSNNQDLASDSIYKLSFNLPAVNENKAINVYYYLFKGRKPIINNPETVFLINDWEIKHYKFKFVNNPVPLLLGNYGKVVEREEQEKEGFIRSNEMADVAKGIPRVGHLRMDVDRLGRIFAEGLGEKKTLPRIAGLSRQMSYFFKVYLNSLAEFRNINKPINRPREFKQLNPDDKRLNLLFIYAGGDDLFVSGAWNEVVEFGFDVYQCFRAFTENNPDIKLSGGICIADAKFPLY
ncbi:MAG: type III-A CRISPR-associated protein Cas10/Csm1, partial [Cyanobacteria bacterium J06641_2]